MPLITMKLERVREYMRLVKRVSERLPDSPERSMILTETHAAIIELDRAISESGPTVRGEPFDLSAFPAVPDYGEKLARFVNDLREASSMAVLS